MKLKFSHSTASKHAAILKKYICFALVVVFFSCNKSDVRENYGNDINETFTPRKSEVSGFKGLLSISTLSDSLKRSFNPNYYKYEVRKDGTKLWIVALRKKCFGLNNAKIIISQKGNQASALILDYNYDERSYVYPDFTTYNGKISVHYTDGIKKEDLIFEKGIFKDIVQFNDVPYALCGNCPPPPNVDWCVYFPVLCSGQGENGPGEVQIPPPPDGGGGGDPFSISSYLTTTLSLANVQTLWLIANPVLAEEIFNYLNQNNPNSPPFNDKKQLSYDHLFNMMMDSEYLQFAENHALNSTNKIVWWEDESWLDNPQNFNLDPGDGYKRLTVAEKKLLKKYPTAAYIMNKFNKPIATNYTVQKFGYNGLNDKSDAFRHAFFQAINTVRVGEFITQEFADAHETETPSQLILEQQMDLYNNNVGIDYGKTQSFPSSTPAVMANVIYQKILNGELKYLFPIWSPKFNAAGQLIDPTGDPNFHGTNGTNNLATATHGITSNTQIILTNQ